MQAPNNNLSKPARELLTIHARNKKALELQWGSFELAEISQKVV